jgi:hypothetical protein
MERLKNSFLTHYSICKCYLHQIISQVIIFSISSQNLLHAHSILLNILISWCNENTKFICWPCKPAVNKWALNLSRYAVTCQDIQLQIFWPLYSIQFLLDGRVCAPPPPNHFSQNKKLYYRKRLQYFEWKYKNRVLPITELLSAPKAHIHCGPPGTWNLQKLQFELKYFGRKVADARLRQTTQHTSHMTQQHYWPFIFSFTWHAAWAGNYISFLSNIKPTHCHSLCVICHHPIYAECL